MFPVETQSNFIILLSPQSGGMEIIMLEKMNDFFKNRVTGYDEHMMANIYGASEFYKFTAEMLPAEEKSKVLDLGCGTGLELEEYFSVNSTAHVTGIDLSSDMLKALSEKFDNKALHLINNLLRRMIIHTFLQRCKVWYRQRRIQKLRTHWKRYAVYLIQTITA